MFRKIRISNCLVNFFSSAFLAFGLYNVHAISGVTEGGVLGLTLLLERWLSISPSVSSLVLNALCYLLGWKILGKKFIFYSVIANIGFSLAYAVCELFPPLWPKLAEMPLLAALIGAVFVGIGAGLCVRFGGAPSGDDALAMSLNKLTRLPIQWLYLISDAAVLLMSLSYIPFSRLIYSIITVVLSGQIIGRIQPHKKAR